jgi:hypothetical protein
MADITLEPNDQLLHEQLRSFAEQLEKDGYDVELLRPEMEWRHVDESQLVAQILITLGFLIVGKEYEMIKEQLRDWFTETRRPKRPRRHLVVGTKDSDGNTDVFVLEDD